MAVCTYHSLCHHRQDTNIASDSSGRRKAASASASASASGGPNRTRPSHHSETHNSTEKRRRCRISDRLRALQQLVPGCEKTNQESTLEQTIQYVKSLKQQVQAMHARPAQAVYPIMGTAPAPAVMMPPAPGAGGPVPLLPAATGVAPFGAMLPYPPLPYHAAMVPAPSAAPPLYRPQQPAASAARAPGAQCSASMEQHCIQGKGRRRL